MPVSGRQTKVWTLWPYAWALPANPQVTEVGSNHVACLPWAAASLIAALAHSGRLVEARAALTQFDPRQAGVFKTSQFGPKLTSLIDEALKLVELNC